MRLHKSTASHRGALLRNLVTSLIQHERISTTLAKAKETQRMAEKIITKAKRGLENERGRQSAFARSFIYDDKRTMPSLLRLAERFKSRPGGYTRLHLHGNRKGDNAPRALLEFVDRPEGDLKLELTAMAMGRETFLRVAKYGQKAVREAETMGSKPLEQDERFQPLTRINAQKVVKFTGQKGRDLLVVKARDHFYRLLATRDIQGDRREDSETYARLGIHKPRGHSPTRTLPSTGERRYAGMRRDILQSGPEEPKPLVAGRPNSVIRIGKGAFAKRQSRRVWMPVASASPSTEKAAA